MTMVPSAHDVVQHHHHYSSSAAGYGGEIDPIRRRFQSSTSSSPSSSSSPATATTAAYNCNNNFQSDRVFGIYNPADDMADEFRPENDPNQPSSSSNRPVEESWLRLGLGVHDQTTSRSSQPHQPTSTPYRSGLMELDLMPGSADSQQQLNRNIRPPAFLHAPEFRVPPPRPMVWLQPEINWDLMRSNDIMARQHHQQQQQQLGSNYYVANNPSMSTLEPMGPNFFGRPYGRQMGLNGSGGDPSRGGISSSSAGGSGMRIIRPPRRPNVGVWFMLQASQNQAREPYLPQIPKSYLRIKDGRMTVRLLIKYLVHKLGLESESEVEIRCRGQEVQPNLTLQHVRDNIWCSRRDAPLTLLTDLSSSSSTLPSAVAADSHIMVLHYARPVSATAAVAITATHAAPFF